MELDKPKRNIVETVKDAIELLGEGLSIAASPSVFFLMTLYNSTGKARGFSGYVTNQVPIVQTGVDANGKPQTFYLYVSPSGTFRIVPVQGGYEVYSVQGVLLKHYIFTSIYEAEQWIDGKLPNT
jgi:hypothetical protein